MRKAASTLAFKRGGQFRTGGHEKALASLKGYASAAEDASLKAIAGETAPVVQHHLTMLQGMR